MVDGLFGPQPAERVKGRGRPAHAWDRQKSIRICNLFACGCTVEMVAKVIGISQPTLRKVYFSEVGAREIMALKVKSEQLARLTEAAIAGSVAAEKALAGMIHGEQIKALGDQVKARRGTAPAAPARVGKKEERQAAAQGVKGRFAPREAPPSLLN
jgi:predicted transcriptional regulator